MLASSPLLMQPLRPATSLRRLMAAEPWTLAPFRLDRPGRQTVPFLFASPHSGRHYPASLLANTRLGPHTPAPFRGRLCRRTVRGGGRAWGAADRGPISPRLPGRQPQQQPNSTRPCSMPPLGLPVDAPSPRVTAGLGVIPRIVRDGAEIYRGKLDAREADARITQLYQPYHAALAALMEETHSRFGVAVVVDCHSMPSALSVPDIVLGDRYGASAAPALTARAEAHSRAKVSRWPATRLTPAAIPRCCMARWPAAPCAADRDQSRALSGRRQNRQKAGIRAGTQAPDARLESAGRHAAFPAGPLGFASGSGGIIILVND